MKEKIFALCDLEESYAFRMAEYIMDKVPMSYTLHLFTRTEELRIFMDKHEISILLIGESAIQKMGEKVNIPHVFILRENGREAKEKTAQEAETDKATASGGENAEGWQYINKFQSPQQIIGQLTEHMAKRQEWDGMPSAKEAKLKVIGVYSPVRRCLQTSFALTMGQLLAREHKVLYLNLECYSGFGQMLQKEFPEDMLDVLYYFNCA